MNRWIQLSAERPGWVLLGVALLTVVTLAGLVDLRTGEVRLQIDPSTGSLMPAEGPEMELYRRARRLFGSDDTIVVALGADDVFAPEVLSLILRMTRQLEGIDGVQSVLSLATAETLRPVGDDLEVAFLLEEVPADAAGAERLRLETLENPLYAGTLVARDASATALLVSLDRMSDRELVERGIDGEIVEVALRLAGDFDVWVTGVPHQKVHTSTQLTRELRYMLPAIILLVGFVLILSLRSVRGVLLPLVAVVLGMIWTLGTLAWLGQELNLITVTVPALILTIGFTYALHVVADYDAVVRAGAAELAPRAAVRETLSTVAAPVLVTGLTTAAGFVSLTLNPVPAIGQFGIFSVMGVAFTLLASLTAVPALLALLPIPGLARRSRDGAWLDRAADGMASFSTDRRRQLIAVYFVVMAVALVGMTQIRVAIKFPGNMDPDFPVRVDWEQINERLGGASPLSVILETDLPEGILEPTNLAAIRSLQEWMEEQPDVGETGSIVDYLMLLNRALHGGDPAHFAVPERQRLASQLLLFGAGPQSQRLIDAPRQTTILHVNATVGDSDKITQLVDRIQARLAELPTSLQGKVTGSGALLYRAQDDVSRGQLISISAAFVFIYLILVVMFTSFRVGLLALFPNVLPILIYFGALGASAVTLNPATSLVGCLALGIAVDDTIHFFVRFNAEARRLADEAKGARAALRALIRPVTFTTLGLCLGFLVLTTSELGSQVQFGLLSAFTIAVAWVVDVTLSPALCSGLRIVTLWDLLTIDIGSEPQNEISIFDGLTHRQTRIVALMGHLIDAPAGQRVFHAGESGSGLYVMISGEVRTWVNRQEGEATLGRYERGETLGEVGLFHGEHAAHCDVEQDARILRLSADGLKQLDRRYPRVAATLHGNLNKTLAARLALRTRESALDDAFFHPLGDGGPGAGAELVLDPSLSETLAGLEIRTETLAALTLIPLVKVAWADDHLDAEERSAVLRGAESVGIIPDSADHALLRAWLEEPPDPKIFEAWRDFVASLCSRLSIEGQIKLREDVLGRAREVAEAAGGFLGVRSISRPEEAVLRELESVFPVGNVERSLTARAPRA